ncbi:MAG: c-type cytochrome [Sulfurimonas sp.]|nr:c-type cytochrome [Sulfurimonas sp.]
MSVPFNLKKLIKRMDRMKKIIIGALILSTAVFAIQSEDQYKHCVVCHGKQGELVAIKSSPKLSSLSEEELSMRLKKILDGSTSLSKNYVGMHRTKLKNLAPEDTEKFAKYIVELKK